MNQVGMSDLGERIKALEAQYVALYCVGTQHRTELRKRVFSDGSEHFVQQCTRCGEQVGGPLKRPPLVPPPFEMTVERRRRELSEALARLRAEKAAATPLDHSDPLALREARRHFPDRLPDFFDPPAARSARVERGTLVRQSSVQELL